MNFNSITIVGRVAQEPQLKYTPSGVAVCELRIAVNRNFKNADGKYEADFFAAKVWRNSGEWVAANISVGDVVLVDGTMESRKYEKEDGTKITFWEINAQNVKLFYDQKKREESMNA